MSSRRRHEGIGRAKAVAARSLLASPPRRLRCAGDRSAAAAATWIEPAARIVGHALRAAIARRRDQRFLHRVFRRREVLEAARDGAEHLRRQLAQQVLGAGVQAGEWSRFDGRRAHDLAHFDRHVERLAARCRAPPTRSRRSRTRARGCPHRRSSSRRGIPLPRQTGRPVTAGAPLRRARTTRACAGGASPSARDELARSASALVKRFMNLICA